MKKKNQIAAAIVLRGLAKDGKFANANANANDDDGKVKAAVKTSEWIKEMHKAVEDTAKAGDGSNDELIANVAVGGGNGNGNGAGADKGSVTGIAKGMKAIVDAAGSTAGKRANTATNAVEAAIGDDGDGNAAAFGDNNMKKKNQIAAAIVLRGLAKGGKFVNANAANTKVKAAVKTSEWIKEMHKAVEDTAKAGTGGSDLIANVAAGAGAGAGKKADVGSVTGIAKGMKAIVDAAGSTAGKRANTATNAVEAAIGDDGDGNAAAFGDNNMKKKNQIAAAIVLRGLAKGGKFVNANAANTKVKAAVKTSEWIKEMHKAVEDTAKAGTGGSDLIANVAAGAGAGAGKKADVGSVTGIAKGMKAIVDAAGSTAGKRANTATNAVEAAIGDDGDGNAAAFGDNNMKKKNQIAAAIVLRGLAKGGKFVNANAANTKVKAAVKTSEWIKEMHKAVEDTAKAGTGGSDLIANVAAGAGAGAGKKADVGSVTGIAKGMKAIVDAAGSTAGKRANTATNAVEAAIGDDGDGNAAAFGDNNMKKKNQIAAAIVLRGLAKGGKFVNANAANTKVKAAVKTSEWIKEMHKAVEDTAKAGTGGSDLIANVAAGAGAGAGKKADVGSVTGIAKGMKAIVDAAGSTAGKRANTATNAVEAAIGDDGDGNAAAFGDNNMKKKNQIAAAIVLRGLAKGGKFANTNNDANGKVVAAVKHMHRATLRLL
ncbi:variable large family protein, partial [Borreliella burgdorferi]|uniref:variable large family protein n=1 Tax=Borreliella burgdorferi TaxID=139 RepID=UPI001AEF4297